MMHVWNAPACFSGARVDGLRLADWITKPRRRPSESEPQAIAWSAALAETPKVAVTHRNGAVEIWAPVQACQDAAKRKRTAHGCAVAKQADQSDQPSRCTGRQRATANKANRDIDLPGNGAHEAHDLQRRQSYSAYQTAVLTSGDACVED
jgi:hypothetical protein